MSLEVPAILSATISSFITIFAIMDPFSSVGSFLTLTKEANDHQLKSVAAKSVVIAGILGVVFTLTGPRILDALSITLSDFKIAGGIVLILLGLETTLGLPLSGHGDKQDGTGLDSAAVLIATPLLTGPGLMTSLVILQKAHGAVPVLAAMGGSLLISWLVFSNAGRVKRLVGDRVVLVFAKVMGLFLMAIGISFVRDGWRG